MEQQNLTARVSELLERKFPGVVINIEPVAPEDPVSGWIVWSGFEGLEHIERWRLVQAALRELSDDDRIRVGPILTLTPFEASDGEAAA